MKRRYKQRVFHQCKATHPETHERCELKPRHDERYHQARHMYWRESDWNTYDYWRRKISGTCVECPAPCREDSVRCTDCARDAGRRSSERWHKQKASAA